MKKKNVLIIISIIIFAVIIVGIITKYIDIGRVTTNKEPKCCIKIVSNDGSRVTYWGLGYKVIRYVSVSPNEPYQNNIGVKMGNWFMKYELPQYKSIKVELLNENKIIKVSNIKDIGVIENILINSKYDNEVCKGENTYRIILDNEIYYIKEDCKEIQKGNKQAKITDEDLNTIKSIISNSKVDNEIDIEEDENSINGVDENDLINEYKDSIQNVEIEVQTALNEIETQQKNVEFVRTYKVIADLKKADQTGNYHYYVVEKFQYDNPIVIKVENKYKLEENKNYEFTFKGEVKKNETNYSMEEIFNNFMIIDIQETNKEGLEQRQDAIYN